MLRALLVGAKEEKGRILPMEKYFSSAKYHLFFTDG